MKIRLFKIIDGKQYEYGTYNIAYASEENALLTAIAYLSSNGIDLHIEVVADGE